MKHFLIVSGGDIDDAFACRMIEKEQPDVVIAADKGMDFFTGIRKYRPISSGILIRRSARV